MRESLLSNSKKSLALTATILFVLSSLIASTVQALSSSSSPNSSSNVVQPYTGGAPIAKVLYPPDGSTVTITSSGAVIKQSPGRTPYREGWINPTNIGGVNMPADLRGQLAGGSHNPYTNMNQPNSNQQSMQSSGNNQTSSNPQPSNQPTNANLNTNTNTNIINNNVPSSSNGQSGNATTGTSQNQPQAQPQPSQPQAQTPSSSTSTSADATSNASANANASVTLAGNNSAQTPAAQSSSGTTSSSAQGQTFTGKSLPNTGPGDVFAIGGIVSVLGTVGHLFYQRLRFRP